MSLLHTCEPHHAADNERVDPITYSAESFHGAGTAIVEGEESTKARR